MRLGTIICLSLLIALALGATNPPSGATTTVQSTPQTYVCDNAYTWNQQICVACMTVSHGTCSCSNYGECSNLVCDDKYYQIGQTCLQHPDSNCISGGLASDGSTIVCYSCATQYTLIGGICVANNLCQTFDLTTGLCTKCATSYFNAMMVLTPDLFPTIQSLSLTYSYNTYYQNIQQCVSCVTGCDNCLSASTCKTCATTYYLTSANICATCASQTTHCVACADSTGLCSACASGFYLSSDQKSCYSCSDTATYTPAHAPAAIANCATCTVSGSGTSQSLTCNSCAAGYIVSSNACSTCAGYPTTCSGCDSNNVCNSCANVAGSVVLYKSSCTTCANCMPGSCAVNSDSTGVICSKCNDTYYLNSSGGCVSCSTATGVLRCTYSNSKVVASQCQNGFFLVNGGCISAATINTCSLLVVPSDGSTASNAACSTCWPGYSQNGSTCFTCNNCTSSTNCTQSTTNTNQTVCSSCISHYYFDSTQSVCTACIANCDSCTGPAIGDCQSCLAGYFKTSSACTACTTQSSTSTVTTCSVCTDATTCTTCIAGYYASNGKCLSCQIGCSQCTSSGNLCTSCVTGYYLQNGGCVQLQSNCLSITTTTNGNSVTVSELNQTNGCTMCAYGFYLTSGWLTQQSSTTQITDQVCLQCIAPESGFVCRANPTQVTQAQVPGTAATTLTTSNYFKYALPLQAQGITRLNAATCKQGYFWNTQTCMPCVAVNNGICTACSNFTDCTTFICNSGYYQLTYNNTTTCVVLPTGCTTLTYSTTEVALACTACSSGYTLVGNICIQNNSCLTISQTNGSCTECQAGYYFNWSFSFQNVINAKTSPANNANYYNYFAQFCSKCYTGCAVCTSAYTCTTCSTGYYWSQSSVTTVYTTPQTQNVFIASNSNTQSSGASGQCLTCPLNCVSCTTGSSCTTCATAYYYDSTATTSDTLCKTCGISQCTSCPGGTCTQCASPYTLSGNSCILAACNSPCATCGADANTCATCPNFYIITGSTCTSCPSYCNACSILSGTTDTTTCTSCQDGYYMVQQTNQQVTCSPCSSQGTGFLRCNGSLENPNQSGVLPIQCNDSYYLSNNTCYAVQSSPTCSTISSSSTSVCATCLPSLTANGNTCALCSTSITNCTTCSANSSNSGYVCSACVTGYVLNTATNTCDKCPGGCQVCTVSGSSLPYTYTCTTCYVGNYKNTATGLCVGCPPSCSVCDSKLTCTTCANGFYLKQSTVLFTTFSATAASQYTFKPCYPCQTGCATCSGPNGNICATCQTGYVLQNSGCVTLSNANCYTYDSNGCTSCLAGFFLDASRVCQECVSPYTNFVCGLKSVTPTTPSTNPGTTTPTTTVTVAIGVNPVQSYSVLLGLLIMVILQ